jgi:hypothetical protein
MCGLQIWQYDLPPVQRDMTKPIFHVTLIGFCDREEETMFNLIDKMVHKVMNSLPLIDNITLDDRSWVSSS